MLSVAGRDLTEHDFVALRLFAALLGATAQAGAYQGELVRRERLAAMGELSAVLAHEIRNPLAVLVNAVSLLRRELRGSESTRVRFATVEEEVARLRGIVSDILALARPEDARAARIALAPLLCETIAACRVDPACPARDERCWVVDVPGDLPDVRANRPGPSHKKRTMSRPSHSLSPGGPAIRVS